MHLEKTENPEKYIEDCKKWKKVGTLKTDEARKSRFPAPVWETAFSQAGILLFTFGATDRVIWQWHRVYSGSVRMNENSGVLVEQLMAECLEETWLAQYENGILLFCLLAEGLPGAWLPRETVQKRIREDVRPLISKVVGKGNGNLFEKYERKGG